MYDHSDKYAMHFGVFGRVPTPEEVEAISEAVAPFGATAYVNGDNFQEWGEHVLDISDLGDYAPGTWNIAQQVALVSGHLLVYVPKGQHPREIWEAMRSEVDGILPVEVIDQLWGINPSAFEGLPFTVDEAHEWGTNVHHAWRRDMEVAR